MIRPRQYILLLGFALLPHITEIENWVWFLSALIVAWALWADHKPIVKPGKILIHVLTLVCPVLIYLEFNTLLGPDAATSLLLLMISLKLFEVYSQRDAIVILALTLLMAMYHLVFRQDLFTTLYMIGVMFWTFYLLFKLHRPLMAPSFQKFQLKGFLGLETLISIPLLLALFFFFPRISSPLGRLMDKQGDQTGFSEDLRPGDLADMANSNEVAFRVEFKSGRPLRKDELYFRGQTLEVTDGINWLKTPGRRSVDQAIYDETSPGQHYRITFEPRFADLVFSLDQTYASRVQGAGSQARYFDNDSIKTKLGNQQKFQLVGVRSDNLIADKSSPVVNHTQLPVSFFKSNPQLEKLIERMRLDNFSVDEKMESIRSYFKKSELTYSFKTPQYENLDQLLFGDKLGFCEHFASAATIMARSLNVPSRVVIGFQGGEINEFGNYLVVRDRHAHAWMEFLSDSGKWTRFDPTAEVSGFRITDGLTLNDIQESKEANATFAAIAKGLWNMVDNINNQFALSLLSMNQNSQLDWLKALGFESPNRRTIWKFFAGVIGLVFILIFLFLWLRRPKLSQIEMLRAELMQKLTELDIGYTEDLGPLETLELLSLERPETQSLQSVLQDYAELRYSQVPTQTADEISRKLRQL